MPAVGHEWTAGAEVNTETETGGEAGAPATVSTGPVADAGPASPDGDRTPGTGPGSDTPLEAVGRRALSGVLNLVVREAAIKALAFGGGIVLARLLDPTAFGLFAVASFAVNLFALFSELGLGAAFIRRRDEVSQHELRALFTFQLVLVALLAVVLFLLAPLIAGIYSLPEAVWVIRALAVSLVLTSLRSVPVVVAERNLRYGPIALADVAGQTAYWLVAISAALADMGVWSLVWAVTASGLVGTAVLYLRTGWGPSLSFDWRPVWHSMRFGLMYQSQTAASFVKDTMIPALGGLIYGSAAVGYLTWAHQLAALPLLLTHLVARVSYPAFARLQHDPRAFTEMVLASLRWTCRVSFPAFAVLIGLSPQIIEYIYGPKWFPALSSLYVLYINMVLGVGTGILMAAVYSLGRAGTGLRIHASWAAATWLIALALAYAGMGFESLAWAYAMGTAAALTALVLTLRDLIPVVPSLAEVVRVPTIVGAITAATLYVLAPFIVHNWWSLAVLALAGGLAGLAANVWQDRAGALAAVRSALRP